MRQIIEMKDFEPIKWVPMRHEADCFIAACAMVIGVTYEMAEEYFGSGEKYSASVLDSGDRTVRLVSNLANLLIRSMFFTDHGYYPVFMPVENPVLQVRRRYLLSAKSYDPKRSYMAHTFVVDETGKVFDPDPNYDPADPKYSIEHYSEIMGSEIVRLEDLTQT